MYRLNPLSHRPTLCVALAATLALASAHAERPKPNVAAKTTDTDKKSAATAQPVTGSVTGDEAPSEQSTATPHMMSAVLSDTPTHLLIGHTAYVTSEKRLTRIYLTNPAVLSAYTATPNEVLVTAKDAGVSSLMIWDESGEAHTYFYSADIDTSSLVGALKAALPNDSVTVRAEGGRVLLSGTVGNATAYQTADKLAAQFSKDVSNAIVVNPAMARQVRLHVRMVEVDRTKLEQMGFNLFSSGGNTLANSTTTQFPSTLTTTSGSSSSSSSGTTYTAGGKTVSVTNPLNFLLYSADLNIGAMIQDLEQRNVLQILAEPNITTISGEKANFLAGGEFPFPVVQGGGVNGVTSITVQFRPYGVKLEFLPQVNSDGSIALKVAPEVSALDFTNAVQISRYTIPALSSRRADTQVVLRDGQTFAISGLLDQRTTDQLGRTPGIASIPILGNLFKSKNVNHSTSELLVLVTPEIVDPNKDEKVKEPALAVKMLDRTNFDSKMEKSPKH